MFDDLGHWLDVGEAARRLGLDPSAVRTLLRRGELAGRRLGQQWLVDATALAAVADRYRSAGRPFSERIAWTVLAELSGVERPWPLAREELSRIRQYRSRPLAELAPRLRGRAGSHRMSVGPQALRRLAEHPRWRLGGGSQGSGAVDAAPLVVYVATSDLDRLVEDAAAIRDDERPNFLVREVSDRYWPFTAGRRGEAVWPIVAKLDRYDLGLEVELSSEPS